MSISVIIPNYNGKNFLEKNLPFVLSAVREYVDGEVEIVIVDDGSTDGSVEYLQENYPEIKLIIKNKNTGFTESCNLGVEKARGKIIILLNNDVSPQKDFIKPLVAHFSDEKVFAVGCLEKSLQNGKEILSGKSIGYFKRGLLWHDRAKDQLISGATFWVTGGSGAFKKFIWQELGGFDPLFKPFYWEDIDLSYRAQKMGYHTIFEPKSIVFHNHESTIGTYYSLQKIKIISTRNQFLFFWKNISDLNLWIIHLIWLPMNILSSFIKGDFSFLIAFLSATLLTPQIIAQRKNIKPLE